jgi:hypothetical protein
MGDFDPSKYLTKVGNADYLEVKWRLVWLRAKHPDAEIETQLVQEVGDAAIFRARVAIPGGGSATGYGSETMSDFRDYLEKSETKAIGRALAALGFGTQFCPDFDFEGGSGSRAKVVDSPIDFASTRERRAASGSQYDSYPAQGGQAAQGTNQTVTPRQLKFIQAVARECGLSEIEVKQEVYETYGCDVPDLGRRDASAYIEELTARRKAAATN